MASKVSYSFGYAWFKGEVSRDRRSNEKTESTTRYIISSMRIERYYSSINENQSSLMPDATQLLDNADYVGFFKACGPTYIRGVRRAQEVVAFFIFKSSSSNRSSEFSQQVKISGWYQNGNKQKSKHNAENSSTRIVIKAYGIGLASDGSETFVAQTLQEYNQVMKFGFKAMTNVDDADSINIGMVYGMEVVPWVENTVFQVAANLLDESIVIPLSKSLIPRAMLISDPTASFIFENTETARAQYKCKEPIHEIDKYGYCCEVSALYDFVNQRYNGENPEDRVCRPLKQLDPVFIKDNMAANGEFVARMDRSVRYKLVQLTTLEKCIGATKAIPERYNYHILKGQDNVKFDGVVDFDMTVFELKMALDPYNDHSMLKHMGKELDEFLDRFIQPCYAALYGMNVGLSPDTDDSYFMAYPWHSHPECTKLSCLGNSMRWDRSNPRGGCIPSMISGKDSPGFNSGQSECKKAVINGELQCRYNSTNLSEHHDNTIKCWKATTPRGRVDYFMSQFCMPMITDRQLEAKAIDALKKAYLTSCTSSVEKSTNVALNKPTTQSNTLKGKTVGYSSNVVDGNRDGVWHRGSVSHTGFSYAKEGIGHTDPFWEVDLLQEFEIQKIMVFHRNDYKLERNQGFKLVMYNDNQEVFTYTQSGALENPTQIDVSTGLNKIKGDKVRITLPGSDRVLQLAEVEVMNVSWE